VADADPCCRKGTLGYKMENTLEKQDESAKGAVQGRNEKDQLEGQQ
jgi:hypothetical protein